MEQARKVRKMGEQYEGFLSAASLFYQEIEDKGSAIPFQFSLNLPVLQIPIGEQPPVLFIQGHNGGGHQVLAATMEDNLRPLYRERRGEKHALHSLSSCL